MGKTKTAFIEGGSDTKLSGEAKYKKKQLEKDSKKSKAVGGVDTKGGQRVSEVTAGPVFSETETTTETNLKPKRVRGKKILASKTMIDRNKFYNISEALELVRASSYSKFDGTVELHGTVKKDDLNVSVALPNPFGKAKKVEVADEKTIEALSAGKIEFDVLLSTPDMMPKLVQFAKLLGPKGLMPNPKNGTIIKDVASAKNYAGDKLVIKTEKKAPLIHVAVGKLSQDDRSLLANLDSVISALGPRQLVKAYLTASMSPSVRLKVQ